MQDYSQFDSHIQQIPLRYHIDQSQPMFQLVDGISKGFQSELNQAQKMQDGGGKSGLQQDSQTTGSLLNQKSSSKGSALDRSFQVKTGVMPQEKEKVVYQESQVAHKLGEDVTKVMKNNEESPSTASSLGDKVSLSQDEMIDVQEFQQTQEPQKTQQGFDQSSIVETEQFQNETSIETPSLVEVSSEKIESFSSSDDADLVSFEKIHLEKSENDLNEIPLEDESVSLENSLERATSLEQSQELGLEASHVVEQNRSDESEPTQDIAQDGDVALDSDIVQIEVSSIKEVVVSTPVIAIPVNSTKTTLEQKVLTSFEGTQSVGNGAHRLGDGNLLKGAGENVKPLGKMVQDLQDQKTLTLTKSDKEVSSSPPQKTTESFLKERIDRIEKMKLQMMDQLKFNLRMIKRGQLKELQMRLHPEMLGKLKVKISHDEITEKLTAVFSVENETVKDILQKNIHELENSLSSHGIEVDSFQINVEMQADNKHFSKGEGSGADVEERKAWLDTFKLKKEGDMALGNSGDVTQPVSNEVKDSNQILDVLA